MTQQVAVRIYRSGNVMQSGRALARQWILEFEPVLPSEVESLMGWTASADPQQQVRIAFGDKESAIAFAERHGWACTVSEPHERPVRPKSYASNFLRPE